MTNAHAEWCINRLDSKRCDCDTSEPVAVTSNEQDINTALAWLEGPWQAAENRRGAANAAAVIRALRDAHETEERLRVRLAKDIYDDGQDHHPPSYVGRKGDVVVIHSIQTAVVSHRGTGGGFVVHDGELELSGSQKANSCVCGEPNSPGTHRTDGPCLAPIGDHHP